MNRQRPNFEKKELALSSTRYVYLPEDIPVYTVEVSHREEIDGDLLQRALDRTAKRMPYLADTLTLDGAKVYYAKNPLPMSAGHREGPRPVGGAETNYHLLDLTWNGNRTWFSMFHGFCDGQGISVFLESVVFHYYCMKDGVEYEPCGIRTDRDEMTEAEVFEPLSKSYEVSPGYVMPESGEMPALYHIPEISLNPGREIREYGFSVPSDAFMHFVKQNGTSPAVMISMLVGEAIRRVHPDADGLIRAVIPASIRRMLGCEETFKNCFAKMELPIHGTPLDDLPFDQRAARLRTMLKEQMDPDRLRMRYNMLRDRYTKRVEEAGDYREELRKPPTDMTMSKDTYYVDYIGTLHKTAYADQMTDIRFLNMPGLGKNLHLNIIEHCGAFRIACLACSDITPLMDALLQVMQDHGLPVQRLAENRFTLPLAIWREGLNF